MIESGLVYETPHSVFGFTPQDVEAPEDPINTRLLARLDRDKALIEVFGAPIYADTTILPRVNAQSHLGPAFFDGHELYWSLWAPQRNALLSIFKRTMPGLDELKVRMQFAEQHALRYAIVKPGHKVTVEHLRGWLR